MRTRVAPDGSDRLAIERPGREPREHRAHGVGGEVAGIETRAVAVPELLAEPQHQGPADRGGRLAGQDSGREPRRERERGVLEPVRPSSCNAALMSR